MRRFQDFGRLPLIGGNVKSLASWPPMVDAGLAVAGAATADTGYGRYSVNKRLLLPAAVNLCTDPQFTAQTFWPADTEHTDVTPGLALPCAWTDGDLPASCGRMVNNGTVDALSTVVMAAAASKDYQEAIHIYAPTVGGTITVTADVYNSGAYVRTVAVGTIASANGSFVRFSGKVTTAASGENQILWKFAFAGGTPSTIYVTAGHGVQESTLTPAFDGTRQGCTWSSTAHASTSSRAVSTLTQALIQNGAAVLGSTGTIAVRFVPLFAGNDGATHRILFVSGDGGSLNPAVNLAKTNGNIFQCYINDGSSQLISSAAQSFAAGTAHCLVLRWTPTTLDLNYDGVDVTQVAHAKTITPVAPIDFQSSATQPFVGSIGPAVFSPQRKENTWVAGIQAGGGVAYLDPERLFFDRLVADDAITPLQGDARIYVRAA